MKLIMVDLDGTLFDTREVNYRAYQEAIMYYGFEIDYQYYCDFCNGRHYLNFLPQITTEDRKILSDMHQRKTVAYFKYIQYARVNRQLVELLTVCRRSCKIALVTTASKKNTIEILNYFNLTDLFDLILTHEDIGKDKPDPEGYLLAMKTFNANPNECLVFEDSDIGIEAAEKSGVAVFVVKGYS
ncbi:MAG: HAD family phosphatase [Bacteroidales bacterium]|nr:HAD family phosphatase [Lachnoclostridium sp.]MCM1384130.1 HAD family phosphatase [Lachnoclostridium sp.]MCM1465690.1 HAD family phosphatase [Bacteroidales bacterium]